VYFKKAMSFHANPPPLPQPFHFTDRPVVVAASRKETISHNLFPVLQRWKLELGLLQCPLQNETSLAEVFHCEPVMKNLPVAIVVEFAGPAVLQGATAISGPNQFNQRAEYMIVALVDNINQYCELWMPNGKWFSIDKVNAVQEIEGRSANRKWSAVWLQKI
jgi:hypothetical protein